MRLMSRGNNVKRCDTLCKRAINIPSLYKTKPVNVLKLAYFIVSLRRTLYKLYSQIVRIHSNKEFLSLKTLQTLILVII